jgi:hypothetical protein
LLNKNFPFRIMDREIVQICEEMGAKNPGECFHHVVVALRSGRDPDELFDNVKRNRPDLFWRSCNSSETVSGNSSRFSPSRTEGQQPNVSLRKNNSSSLSQL